MLLRRSGFQFQAPEARVEFARPAYFTVALETLEEILNTQPYFEELAFIQAPALVVGPSRR